jgi:predicted DNA-binding ribbon-helix-helix protein
MARRSVKSKLKRQPDKPQKRRQIPKSIVVTGHRASATLEHASWQALKTIAAFERIQVADLVLNIDREDQQDNLSAQSACSLLQRAWPSRRHDRQTNLGPNGISLRAFLNAESLRTIDGSRSARKKFHRENSKLGAKQMK